MSVIENVNMTLQKTGEQFEGDPSFDELRKFFVEMQSKGLAVKKDYSIPMIDTIGRTISYRTRTALRW
jgi:hexokinase